MEVLKVGLVIAAGLGSTWVARAATDALLGPSPAQFLMQAAEPAPADRKPVEAAKTPPPAVPEMSRQEMEDELKRAQAEIAGGGKDAEMREFRPTRPLPADLPIALPSDI